MVQRQRPTVSCTHHSKIEDRCLEATRRAEQLLTGLQIKSNRRPSVLQVRRRLSFPRKSLNRRGRKERGQLLKRDLISDVKCEQRNHLTTQNLCHFSPQVA